MNAPQLQLSPATVPVPVSVEETITRSFPVLAGYKDAVDRALAALVKRAVRLHVTPLAWTWGQPETGKVSLGGGRNRLETRVPLTIVGESPSLNGWRFAATLQYLDGQNIVHRVAGGDAVPQAYWTRGPVCDHCGLGRKRSDTFVLYSEDEGRYMQVGSTCLDDFLGSDKAGKVAAGASLFADACACAQDSDGFEGMGQGRQGTQGLAEYLSKVATAVRVWGWRSAKQASEQGGFSTREMIDRASARDAKVEERLPPSTETDEARALLASEWAAGLTDRQIGDSDYLHNVRTIARSALVDRRTMGIAASIIPAYDREVERERVRLERTRQGGAAASEWFGTIGKREEFVLTLRHTATWDSDYGTTFCYRFADASGNVAVWKASSNLELENGLTYRILGTVKDHSDYKGTKQTMITRCKNNGKVMP